MESGVIRLEPSDAWSDDLWWRNQTKRTLSDNQGYLPIVPGFAQGRIIGGNICTLNLLQGTPYMPSLQDAILFLEDDEESQPHHFDRDLQSLIHLPDFSQVKGMVLGRFQKASAMKTDALLQIITSKKELQHLPVVANVDFGHTDPKITFPIGGEAIARVSEEKSVLEILTH